jgi:hypothetical protein
MNFTFFFVQQTEPCTADPRPAVVSPSMIHIRLLCVYLKKDTVLLGDTSFPSSVLEAPIRPILF